MNHLPITLPNFLSFLATLGILVYMLYRRDLINYRISLLISASATAITLSAWLQAFSHNLPEYLFFAKVQLVALSVMPGCILFQVFTLAPIGKKPPALPILLLTIPQAALLFAGLRSHNLSFFFSTAEFSVTPIAHAVFEYGYGFYVYFAYIQLFFFGGLIALLYYYRKSMHVYRKHLLTLIVIILLPSAVFGFMAYHGKTPVVNPLPMVIGLTAVFTLIAISRFNFLGFAAVAQSTVFNTLPNPVFVFSPGRHLTDVNEAAGALLGTPVTNLIGKPIAEIPEPVGSFVAEVIDTAGRQIEFKLGSRHFQARVIPLGGADRPMGLIVAFDDVTLISQLL